MHSPSYVFQAKINRRLLRQITKVINSTEAKEREGSHEPFPVITWTFLSYHVNNFAIDHVNNSLWSREQFCQWSCEQFRPITQWSQSISWRYQFGIFCQMDAQPVIDCFSSVNLMVSPAVHEIWFSFIFMPGKIFSGREIFPTKSLGCMGFF